MSNNNMNNENINDLVQDPDIYTDDFENELLEILEPKKQGKLNPDQKLSLCMIVKDEEQFIEQCLKSVINVVDEIIIVDTGSTDKTIEIAKKYTDKIFHHKWNNDFAEARNESLKHATGNWILILDADEVLPSDTHQNLRVLLIEPVMPTYFELLIRNYTSDDECFEHYMIRLFSNFHGIEYKGKLHEQPSPLLYKPIIISDDMVSIDHFGYKKEIFDKKSKTEKRNPLNYGDEPQNEGDNAFQAFNISNIMSDLDERIKYMKKAIDVRPNSRLPYVYISYWKLIHALVIKKQYDEAIEIAQRALKEAPDIVKYVDFWANLALAYLLKEKYEIAIEYFQKAIDTRNNKDEIVFAVSRSGSAGLWSSWYNMSFAYWHMNNYVKAKECIMKALELKPNNVTFYWQAITASLKCYDYQNAEILYNKLREIAPKELNNVYTGISNIYLKQEKVYKALEIQNQCYGGEIVRNNALKLAENYEKGSRYDLALEVYHFLTDTFPDYIEAYCKKTELYRDLGQFIDALRAAESAKQYSVVKKDISSMLRVGSILLSLKQIVAAWECFVWVIETEPANYEAPLYISYVHQVQGEFGHAICILENTIAKHPEEIKAYIQLGNLLIGIKNFKYARQIFQKAIELSPSSYYPYYGLGIAQLSTGEFTKAKDSFNRALRINPDDPNIKNALDLIYRNN